MLDISTEAGRIKTAKELAANLPKTQKAVVVKKKGDDFKVEVDNNYPLPELKPGYILVRLTSSGICHSDLSFIKKSWAVQMLPGVNVAGHEGAGFVVKHGEGVDPNKYPVGTAVGVPLIQGNCGKCRICLEVEDGETICPDNKFYAAHIEGTWQQFVPVRADYVVVLPPKLDHTVVGPVLCGGVTVYKGLKRTQAKKGDWVCFTGAGGGLGAMGIQFAVDKGLRVIAIDSGDDKKEQCLKLGAEVFVDYMKEDVTDAVRKITDGFGAQGIVLVAPSVKSMGESLQYVAPNGVACIVGLPPAGQNISVDPFSVIWTMSKITGSVVGTRADIAEALEVAARGKLNYPYHIVKPEQVQDVLEKMNENKLIGRAVIDLV